MTYALGRGMDYADMPAGPQSHAERRRRTATGSKSLVTAVVLSDNFSMNVVPDADPVPAKTGERLRCAAAARSRGQEEAEDGFSDEPQVCRGALSCAGWGRRWRCRFWNPCCRPSAVRAYAQQVLPTRFVGAFVPHGVAPGYWIPGIERTGVSSSPMCTSRSSHSASTSC